jgi:tetratricopeptide (TPR) repeat protein
MPSQSHVDTDASVTDTYSTQILVEATAICRIGLATAPRSSTLLRMRGHLALKARQYPFALACLDLATQLAPENEQVLGDYAEALFRMGRYSDVVDTCRHRIVSVPNSALLFATLGRSLFRLGHHEDAARKLERALELAPSNPNLLCDLADAFNGADRPADALTCYRQAMAIAPEDAEVYVRFGGYHLARRAWADAEEVFRQGLEYQPRSSGLHVGLGAALFGAGAPLDATRAIREGLALSPQDVHACRLLVMAEELLGRPSEIVEAWYGLGRALEAHDNFDHSLTAYQQALRRQPSHPRALLGLALCHVQRNEPAKAIPCLQALVDIDPHHFLAHRRLGQAHAALGDIERLWEQDRWCVERSGGRQFTQPNWNGSDLTGRTILLWQNYGIGDTIQMLRFVPFVKSVGATVLIQCDRALVPLLRHQTYVDRAVAQHTPLLGFDTHAVISSLPGILGVRLANLPNQVPYLSVDSRLVESWRRRLIPDGRKLVGIVWAGHPNPGDERLRFAPLHAFAPLVGLDGVRFISLQLGPQAEELIAPPRGLQIERHLEERGTLDDTAALIENLDLVIAVDMMVVHLAGALGKPVWTMLSYAADCRWLLNLDTSPWYPTMRLFRQKTRGDWLEVVGEIRTEFQRVFLEHGAHRVTDLHGAQAGSSDAAGQKYSVDEPMTGRGAPPTSYH